VLSLFPDVFPVAVSVSNFKFKALMCKNFHVYDDDFQTDDFLPRGTGICTGLFKAIAGREQGTGAVGRRKGLWGGRCLGGWFGGGRRNRDLEGGRREKEQARDNAFGD
jgi:hypothetical protein